MNLMLWLYLYSCCVVDDAETVEEDYENDSNGEVEIEAPSNNKNSTYRTNIDQGNMLYFLLLEARKDLIINHKGYRIYRQQLLCCILQS